MAPKKKCCICCRNEKKAGTFRRSDPYDGQLEGCFGAKAENRKGWLCGTCKNKVAVEYKNNPDITFEHLVDSEGQHGVYGHRKPGFKKRPALATLSQNSSATAKQRVHVDHQYSSCSSFQSPVTCTNTASTSRFSGTKETPARRVSLIKPRVLNVEQRPHDHLDDHDDVDDQNVSRKRPTDEIHVHVRTPPAKKIKQCPKPPPPCSTFLGQKLPHSVIKKILTFCSAEDVVNVSSCEKEDPSFVQLCMIDLASRLKKSSLELEKLKRKVDVPIGGPLTQPQKELLSKLIRNKQNNLDKDGLLVINHRHGKPSKFLEVPSTQESSSSAAASTKVRRAKLIERLTNILSTVKGNPLSSSTTESVNATHDKCDDVHSQVVTLIKRNRDVYARAAEEAGIKIVARFRKETVLALRSVMTQTMWRMIRRTFKNEAGRDVFMSEDNLKDQMQDMQFEYECGTFNTPSGDEKIHFVRVVNVEEVVKKTVEDLRKAGLLQQLENIPDDMLWVHVSADKGGKSTKLILQIINVAEGARHSIKQCKILGFFEGKDNRLNLEEVFGPTLTKLKETVDNISSLNLQRPTFTKLSSKRKPAPGRQIIYVFLRCTCTKNIHVVHIFSEMLFFLLA